VDVSAMTSSAPTTAGFGTLVRPALGFVLSNAVLIGLLLAFTAA
jgi:hypothetical protein